MVPDVGAEVMVIPYQWTPYTTETNALRINASTKTHLMSLQIRLGHFVFTISIDTKDAANLGSRNRFPWPREF